MPPPLLALLSIIAGLQSAAPTRNGALSCAPVVVLVILKNCARKKKKKRFTTNKTAAFTQTTKHNFFQESLRHSQHLNILGFISIHATGPPRSTPASARATSARLDTLRSKNGLRDTPCISPSEAGLCATAEATHFACIFSLFSREGISARGSRAFAFFR